MPIELNDQPRLGEPQLNLSYKRMGDDNSGLSPVTLPLAGEQTSLAAQLVEFLSEREFARAHTVQLEAQVATLEVHINELLKVGQATAERAYDWEVAHKQLAEENSALRSQLETLEASFTEQHEIPALLVAEITEARETPPALVAPATLLDLSSLNQTIRETGDRLVVAADRQTAALTEIAGQLTLANAPKSKWWRFWE